MIDFYKNLPRRDRMQAITLAVHSVVSEHRRTKRWDADSVKFTIRFNGQGRVTQIAYTSIPEQYENELIDRVRDVAEPHGKRFAGMLVNVVIGFKNISRN